MLHATVPKATWRAYVDDIGGVVPDVAAHGRSITALSDRFALVSGLFIHRTKTVLLPLWTDDLMPLGSPPGSPPRCGRMPLWPLKPST